MKRCALFVAVAFVILSASCARGGVGLSAFPDPVFREYLKMHYDYGWKEYDSDGYEHWVGRDDGILDDKEIDRITGIRLENSDIKSLKGIEHLTALTYLYCSGNQLTELDVSNNTALTQLWCSDNQLTELNVSGCTALRWLRCYSNQLTELDLSNNTSLSQAYCWEQKRSGLKVKRNSEGY